MKVKDLQIGDGYSDRKREEPRYEVISATSEVVKLKFLRSREHEELWYRELERELDADELVWRDGKQIHPCAK